jgi:predicted enzyme related to lactoylglutathione lyase
MLNLNSVMIGTTQPEVLAAFYQKVVERKPDMEDGGWFGWQIGSCFLTIGEHSEVNGEAKEPQRIILNFETPDVEDEFDRIKNIDGVTVIKEPYDMGGGLIATFADPDGNYFQLMSPWDIEEDPANYKN